MGRASVADKLHSGSQDQQRRMDQLVSGSGSEGHRIWCACTQEYLEGSQQIFARVNKPDFNCLEITKIVENHFWGMPYTTVHAHSRHIQQGSIMELANESKQPTTTVRI